MQLAENLSKVEVKFILPDLNSWTMPARRSMLRPSIHILLFILSLLVVLAVVVFFVSYKGADV